MKKLAFSVLFFSAIAWLWIGHMIAADGVLSISGGTMVTGGGGGGVVPALGFSVVSTTNSSAASGRVAVLTNGTVYIGTNFTGAIINGGVYGTNVLAVDVPGLVRTLIIHTNGHIQAANTFGVGAGANATTSSILISDGAGNQGFISWYNGATRRGFMGNGTTTIPLTLENSATFQVLGGDQYNAQSIIATNSHAWPTSYVAANFAPLAGHVKIVSSNGILWKVSQLSTNLLSAGQVP